MSALVLKTTLPEEAFAFRTGGDEFIAFVPSTTKEKADEIVRAMIAKADLFKFEEGGVSISFGTSVVECADDNPLDAIAHADRAMYVAKRERKAHR